MTARVESGYNCQPIFNGISWISAYVMKGVQPVADFARIPSMLHQIGEKITVLNSAWSAVKRDVSWIFTDPELDIATQTEFQDETFQPLENVKVTAFSKLEREKYIQGHRSAQRVVLATASLIAVLLAVNYSRSSDVRACNQSLFECAQQLHNKRN